MCTCNDYLVRKVLDITCFIINNSGEVTLPGKTWIGVYSGKFAVHKFCPLDYCNPESHSVDLQ